MTQTTGKLLILDDDLLVSMTIREMAQAAGFTAHACTAADDFFEQCKKLQPTHLILDLAMPGVDGVEVMRRLAQEGCQATIIIVSGLGDKVLNSAKTAADESGLYVAGVLSKPFRINALRTLLSSYISPQDSDTPDKRTSSELSQIELQEALDNLRLVVFYQPQISCHDRSIKGFEALVRIKSKAGEFIAPDRFIPLAERTGLIHQLTEQVFAQAIGWFADHLAGTDYTLALNTSPSTLADQQFPTTIERLCANHGLAPNRVKLEITETSTAENPSMALELLTQLRVKGFLLAIDDFGVGFSSLEQLVRQPFSELKIDKNFIVPLARSEESRKIAASLIALAKALKLTTTAEGVEDEQSLSYLAQAGCDQAQGYFIGRPMDTENLKAWLKSYPSQVKSSS